MAGAVFRGLQACLGDLEIVVSWNCRRIGISYVDIISRGSCRTSYASDSFFRGRRSTCVTRHRKIAFRIGRLTSRCGRNSVFLSLAVARCRFYVCKCNPLGTLCLLDRSGCSAVLILLMECRWRSAWGIFCFGSCNPLRSLCVSDRSRCRAVPILISSAQPSRYFLRVGS